MTKEKVLDVSEQVVTWNGVWRQSPPVSTDLDLERLLRWALVAEVVRV